MHLPIATYRIQFNHSFPFQSAGKIISYLSQLGISDIYASPIFKARVGSMHGYDVVDADRLNPELGSDKDFEDLMSEIRHNSMYWLQDIVPNHMAYDSQNKILMDVLENTEHSEFFHFFDIDWDHFYESLKGRLLAPFLGKFYAQSLEEGEIQLKYDEKGLWIHYYSLQLPLQLKSYTRVFNYNSNRLEDRLGGNNPDFIKFLGALNLFETLPSSQKIQREYDQGKHAKIMLWELYNQHKDIKTFMDENITLLNGQKGEIESFNNLDDILSEQSFRLSFWKVAAEEINYRRFFTINGLISLRVEDEAVFQNTHKLIFRYIEEGKFDGLRVDHIDGLCDPTMYLERIREKADHIYLIVEKILDFNEQLPSFWPVQGTTGYDFLNYVNGFFCNIANKKEFVRVYYKFTHFRTSYDDLVSEKKRLIIGKHMAGNIDNLAQLMKNIAGKERYGRDITLYGLKRALVEFMTFFPVYRSYINEHMFTETDKQYIQKAIQDARHHNPDLLYELNFIDKFFSPDFADHLDEEGKKQLFHFIMRVQQFTGPIIAKGFEDTVLYIYNKLVSLNEVGGSPNRFGVNDEEFHAFQVQRAADFPHSLNATSTHDNKRGEDVRARINVLSEIPSEWNNNLRRWSRLNKRKKKKVHETYMPDENDEYFLYQTLLGVFPFYEHEEKNLTERIKEYIIKAVREAKRYTAWIKPDTEYENACISFVEKILESHEKNLFLEEFRGFQKKIAFYGIFNSLSQTLIKITAPGVPDFYQGTELWELSLVDPDNRRPVDYEKRKEYLSDLKEKEQRNILKLIEELLATKEDGRIKLFLIFRTLTARREVLDIFQKGIYIPLTIEGGRRECLIAYARNFQDRWAITIAPRFLTSLVKEGEYPIGDKAWTNTRIRLPKEAPYSWYNAISHQRVFNKETLSAAEVLHHFPVALLISNHESQIMHRAI